MGFRPPRKLSAVCFSRSDGRLALPRKGILDTTHSYRDMRFRIDEHKTFNNLAIGISVDCDRAIELQRYRPDFVVRNRLCADGMLHIEIKDSHTRFDLHAYSGCR